VEGRGSFYEASEHFAMLSRITFSRSWPCWPWTRASALRPKTSVTRKRRRSGPCGLLTPQT
jgi:hypothetical protein